MTDTLVIAGTIFLVVYMMATVAYLMFRKYMGIKERELQVEHARLDDFRAHLERQLMELNAKFASSEGRWRELNHLVLAGQSEHSFMRQQKLDIQSSLFFESHGVDLEKIKPQSDLVFVITPFHDDFKDEFDTVTSVGEEFGFKVLRGDEKVGQGDIFPQLLRLMVSARVVIANISGRNPNVFYELGIAHAIGKPVILLSHWESETPFDVQSKQIVFYRSNDDLQKRLSKVLARTLVERDT